MKIGDPLLGTLVECRHPDDLGLPGFRSGVVAGRPPPSLGDEHRLERVDVLGKGRSASRHDADRSLFARPEARLSRLIHFATAYPADVGAVSVRPERASSPCIRRAPSVSARQTGSRRSPLAASGTCPRPALTVRVCGVEQTESRFGAQPGRPVTKFVLVRFECRIFRSIAWATSVPAASEPATAQQKGEVNVSASIS